MRPRNAYLYGAHGNQRVESLLVHSIGFDCIDLISSCLNHIGFKYIDTCTCTNVVVIYGGVERLFLKIKRIASKNSFVREYVLCSKSICARLSDLQ